MNAFKFRNVFVLKFIRIYFRMVLLYKKIQYTKSKVVSYSYRFATYNTNVDLPTPGVPVILKPTPSIQFDVEKHKGAPPPLRHIVEGRQQWIANRMILKHIEQIPYYIVSDRVCNNQRKRSISSNRHDH